MIKKFTGKISSFLVALESKVGLLAASFILAVLLLLLAMLYVQPDFSVNPKNHGYYFAQLSEHPFLFSENNPLQYRILAPFIGYITFLRGNLFFIVPLLFDVFLLAAVYYHYRKINYNVTDAFIMTAFMGLSGTVLISFVMPGYIDSITYLFLFLAFAEATRVKRSAFFFGLALLNYETGLMLLPALYFYMWNMHKTQKLIGLKLFFIFFAACLPYIVYRFFVSRHTDVVYSFPFYFSYENIYGALVVTLSDFGMGAFYAFRLLWFFPLFGLYMLWRQKEKKLLYVVILILVLTAAQLIIALDTSRLFCLAFPAVLLSAEYLKKTWPADYFSNFSLRLLLFNFFILPYFVWDNTFMGMPSVFNNALRNIIFHLVDFLHHRFFS